MGERDAIKNRAAVKAWKKANPEKARAASARYRARHPERMAAFRKNWAAKRYAKVKAEGTCAYCQRVPARPDSIICQDCQDKVLWDKRKRKYGIEKAEFFRLLDAQESRCAICSVTIGTSAHVDHDHDSGAVRGLLCRHCNMGIGYMRDSSAVTAAAAAYLKRWGK